MALLKKKLRKKLQKQLVKLLIKHGEKVMIGVVSGGVSRLIEAATGDSDQKKIKKAAKAAAKEVRAGTKA